MPRAGFSLIELLVVIIVIGILAALLLPAIARVRQTVREAQVTTDINNLDQAIAKFKLDFGMEPPSSLVIYEQATGWSANTDALTNNSKAIIRQIWPQFDFTANVDADNDGAATSTLRLDGSECLTFFLGGVYTINSGKFAASGFSSNPANPFAAGGTRKGPYFGEPPTSRFVDRDGDRIPELLDTLPNQQSPYLYFSSYNGRGYQPFGYDGAVGGTDNEFTIIPPPSAAFDINMDSVVYRIDNLSSVVADPDPQAINAKTYQIISPGFDGEYFGSSPTTTAVANRYTERRGGFWSNESSFLFPAARSAEQDNITNFSGGRLD